MNPLTMLADRARCIAYDYGTRTSRIDVHQRVTLLRESYVYAFTTIDPEMQTIEVLCAGKPYASYVRNSERRWTQQHERVV